ncbi:MAG: hypothetical protein AAGB22_14195, partial [Bacteroidota bacterium]
STDNRPTLAADDTKLNALELVRYSKNPWMLKAVKVYKFNGQQNPVLDPGLVLTGEVALDYSVETQSLIDNEHSFAGTATVTSDRVTNYYLLRSIEQIPTNPSEDNPAAAVYTPGQTPSVFFDYDVLASVQSTDTVLRTNLGGALLTRVTNHLGGVTDIAYNPLSSTKTFLTSRNNAQAGCIQNKAASDMARQMAVDVNFSVHTISRQTDGAPQVTEYRYGTRTTRVESPFLDASHFSTVRLSGRYGFSTDTVYQPEIAPGVRPYTVYTHHNHNDPLLFGQVKKVEQFDANGTLLEKQETTFQANTAYKNGVNRPGTDRAAWLYDYHDYGYASLADGDIQFQDMVLGNYEAPRFYEVEKSFNLPDALYMDSYFIKKTRDVVTRYDANGCSKSVA